MALPTETLGKLRAQPALNQTGLLHGTVIHMVTFVPVVLLLVIAWLQPVYPVAELLRDPLAVAELSSDCCHVHYGLISNLGVLAWCSTAAILLFAAGLALLRRYLLNAVLALACGGMFTGWLMLDDLFMVHEDVLPALGVSQTATYAVYAGLGLGYLAIGYRQILRGRISMFAAAIGLLAMSAAIDGVIHSDSDLRLMIEDGAKLAGIIGWSSFHIEMALRILSDVAGNDAAPALERR